MLWLHFHCAALQVKIWLIYFGVENICWKYVLKVLKERPSEKKKIPTDRSSPSLHSAPAWDSQRVWQVTQLMQETLVHDGPVLFPLDDQGPLHGGAELSAGIVDGFP